MSEKKYLICPECGGAAHRLYPKEELEKKYPDDPLTRLNLGLEFQCADQLVCAYTFRATREQIIKAYVQQESDAGKSPGDILREARAKAEEIRERERNEQG